MSSGRLSFSFHCVLRSGVVLLGIADCLAYLISERLCGGLLLFYRLAFVPGIKGLMDLTHQIGAITTATRAWGRRSSGACTSVGGQRTGFIAATAQFSGDALASFLSVFWVDVNAYSRMTELQCSQRGGSSTSKAVQYSSAFWA